MASVTVTAATAASTIPTLTNPAKQLTPLETLQQAIITFVASDQKIRAGLTDVINSSNNKGTSVYTGTAVQNPYAELHNRVRTAISSTDVFSGQFTEDLMSVLVGEFDPNADHLTVKTANALLAATANANTPSSTAASPSSTAASPSSDSESSAKLTSFLSVTGPKTDGRSSPLPSATAAAFVAPNSIRLSKTVRPPATSTAAASNNTNALSALLKSRKSISGTPFQSPTAASNPTTITISPPTTTE